MTPTRTGYDIISLMMTTITPSIIIYTDVNSDEEISLDDSFIRHMIRTRTRYKNNGHNYIIHHKGKYLASRTRERCMLLV